MRFRCISIIKNEASLSNLFQAEKKYSNFSLLLKKSKFRKRNEKHILKQFMRLVKMNKRITIMN